MFGIGFSEFIVLAIIIIVLIGPKQLPEIMKTVGKIFREFSKARDDLRKTIDQDDSFRSIRESVDDVKNSVQNQVEDFRAKLHAELIAQQDRQVQQDKQVQQEKKLEEEKKAQASLEKKPHE